MKEIDFLPEWYKERRRRKVSRRRQCIALGLIVVAMIAYNVIATHEIACATAELEQLEDHRVQAEDVMHRFDKLSREVAEYQAETESLSRMDSRIESAAVIAEISHIIGERAVLSRIEFIAEPVGKDNKTQMRNGSAVRAAGPAYNAGQPTPLADVKFRILLAGVAANAEDVGELICRLDESSYFRDVHSSGFRNSTIDVPIVRSQEATSQGTGKPAAEKKQTLQVSEFKITCYLANYDEIESE